jgi:hypothetical protein
VQSRPDNRPMHLLIPFANCNAPECQHVLATLKLPNLDRLLRQLHLAHTDNADEHTLSPPHERALAAAYGIALTNVTPDGQTPWGAWHAAQAGHATAPADAWAVITPCHWTVQTSHITMTHPRALNLMEEESRALLAAMQPYFAEDGIALMYDTPTRWLARGAVFVGLATASPYRVVGGHVDDWLPKAASAKLLRRLQNEMQMLLYTHPLTDARAALGLPAVNSFWVSGTGALPPGFSHSSQNASTSEAITVPNALRDAAIQDDWAAWAQAWQQIDGNECAALLQAIDMKASMKTGPTSSATLTLCGERSAQTWQTGQNGLAARFSRSIRGYFSPQPSSTVLSQL